MSRPGFWAQAGCLVLLCSVAAAGHAAENVDCMVRGAFATACNQRLQALKKEITELISRPLCNDSNQCRTAGVGVKSCGGPAAYVTYSTSAINESHLMMKLKEYNGLARQQAEYMARTLGVASDCMMVADPGALCLSGQCALRGR